MVPANNRPTFLPERTLAQIKEGLQQTFPSLISDSGQLKLLNDGFSSYVVLVDDEFILRIAKHAESMASHREELTVLPLLQRRLPLQVPQPIWRAEPSAFFPFGVLGYRAIKGVPFSLKLVHQTKLDRVTQDLARFLAALHNIPPAEMIDWGLTANQELESLREEVIPFLDAHLTKEDYEKIVSWWEGF